MKKLEKEELLKVIGILAEAEGYDLLTMNKYGSNPSSIAVLCSETGVEYAPVDMDAVVGEYTAGKMDIADIYKSLKNELLSDLQLKFPERQMRKYQQTQQQTQYHQPVKPAGPVCVEISDADIEKLLEHPEAAVPVRSANQSVQALEDELDKEIQKSEEALRGPKADKPANPLPVVTKEPVDLSLDDEPGSQGGKQPERNSCRFLSGACRRRSASGNIRGSAKKAGNPRTAKVKLKRRDVINAWKSKQWGSGKTRRRF